MSCCLRCCRANSAQCSCEGRRELLVLGLEGAGKSLLMRQLCNLANNTHRNTQQIQPTVGVELYKLSIGTKPGGQVVRAREIGGCMLPVWPQYFTDAKCLLYVLNLSDASQLAAATVELHNLHQHPDLQGTPVCIAFAQHTKQKPALPLGVLDHVTGMHSLHAAAPGLLSVVDISLNDGTGLHEILAWVKAIY